MHKINDLQKSLAENQMSSLLILDPVNIRYLTGFTGSSGYLLITPSQAILLTDFRYEEQAKKQVNQDVSVKKHDSPMYTKLQEVLDTLKIESLYFEKHYLTYEGYEYFRDNLHVEILPASDFVAEMRMIKDEDELEFLKASIGIADEAFLHIVNYIEEGVTEKELSIELEYFMKNKGADKTSFDIIVASGERSALPHGIATDKVIKRGELIKMDFGAYYQGYCSDMTRTIVLGTANHKQKQVYELVLQAQLNALRHMKDGLPAWKADSFARKTIENENMGAYFGHGLGHGVGMKVHELPRMSPRHDRILEPGMTVTVEPGVYIPGWGGVRIEDIVCIKKNGIEVLTKSTKDLIEI